MVARLRTGRKTSWILLDQSCCFQWRPRYKKHGPDGRFSVWTKGHFTPEVEGLWYIQNLLLVENALTTLLHFTLVFLEGLGNQGSLSGWKPTWSPTWHVMDDVTWFPRFCVNINERGGFNTKPGNHDNIVKITIFHQLNLLCKTVHINRRYWRNKIWLKAQSWNVSTLYLKVHYHTRFNFNFPWYGLLMSFKDPWLYGPWL